MNSVKVVLLFLLLVILLIPARAVNAQLDPFLQVTPSASPTVTSFFASTPSKPSATITAFPTNTPFVVTVIHTKIITVVAPTQTPAATAKATITPTYTAVPTESDDTNEKETDPQSPLTIAIIGMVSTFIAGIVVGILLSRSAKR
jgi:hypothetical protein